MNVILYGRMLELPIAQRGEPAEIPGESFTTQDGRSGIVIKAGQRELVPCRVVNMTATELALLSAAYLYHPTVLHRLEDRDALIFAWRQVPPNSTWSE